MKFIAIPILILLIATQVFSKWFLVLSFRLNQDYIAKNLCENRYRPKLNCKGNCVLMKKMKQEEERENAPVSIKVEIASIVVSSKSYFATLESPLVANTATSIAASNSGKPVDRATEIFHPPGA